MSGPLIYIGRFKIKPGKLEQVSKACAELADFVETNEPRVILFHLYLDEAGEKLTVLHVHPDAASMEFHMQINAKHFATAYDNLESIVSEQFYGQIPETLASEIAKWHDPDVPVTRMPVHQAGFTRTTAR